MKDAKRRLVARLGALLVAILAAGPVAAETVQRWGRIDAVEPGRGMVVVSGKECRVSAGAVLRGLRGQALSLAGLEGARKQGPVAAWVEMTQDSRRCSVYEIQLVEELPS